MKILIVSDTHGNCKNFDIALQREKPIDMLIHCGDTEGDEDYIPLVTKCPVYIVAGNNDFRSGLSQELLACAGPYRLYITHGHLKAVYFGVNGLIAAAKTKGAQVVCYGHTHVPDLREIDGVTLINPGSLTHPRQLGRRATYVVLEIDDEGNKKAEIREV